MYERHVGFVEAVKLGFQNYFKFSGRAQRAEYWWFYLFTVIATLVLSLFDMYVLGVEDVSADFAPTSDIFSLAVLIPTFAVGWRRMHDIGRSGWWFLLPFAPLIWAVVGAVMMFTSETEQTVAGISVIGLGVVATLIAIVYVIMLLATDSDMAANRFGPSPKYGEWDDTFA